MDEWSWRRRLEVIWPHAWLACQQPHLAEHAAVVLEDLGHAVQELHRRRRRDVEARRGAEEEPVLAHKEEVDAVDVEDGGRVPLFPELDLPEEDLGGIGQGVAAEVLWMVC